MFVNVVCFECVDPTIPLPARAGGNEHDSNSMVLFVEASPGHVGLSPVSQQNTFGQLLQDILTTHVSEILCLSVVQR